MSTMNKRFASGYGNSNEMSDASVSELRQMYVKRYPNFFKRDDVRDDFVAIQRELRSLVPTARVIKEDLDTLDARVQFDVPKVDEVLLEKALAKRGYVPMVRRQ